MTEMPDRESAEAIDNVLELFRGDKTVVKTELQKQYTNDMRKYYETENHLSTLLSDGLIKIYKNPGSYVLDHKGFSVISKMQHWGYTAKYNANEKKKIEEENRNPANIDLSGNKGAIFYHSPVSESIINTTLNPTISPKKRMNITKIIAIASGIITIILGLYFLYDRYFKD